jgi:hypothetical protein
MKNFSFLFCVLALTGFWSFAQARPLTPAEDRAVDYSGQLPLCDHEQVFAEISSLFRDREQGDWSSDLEIVNFRQAQEIVFRPKGADFVPRRYCRALVWMNDQKLRDISYSIGEREGLIGFT